MHLYDLPVYWKSQLQPTVSDFPNAAEYIGLREAGIAAMGVKNLPNEIGLETGPPTLHEDNDEARRLASDGLEQKKAGN